MKAARDIEFRITQITIIGGVNCESFPCEGNLNLYHDPVSGNDETIRKIPFSNGNVLYIDEDGGGILKVESEFEVVLEFIDNDNNAKVLGSNQVNLDQAIFKAGIYVPSPGYTNGIQFFIDNVDITISFEFYYTDLKYFSVNAGKFCPPDLINLKADVSANSKGVNFRCYFTHDEITYQDIINVYDKMDQTINVSDITSKISGYNDKIINEITLHCYVLTDGYKSNEAEEITITLSPRSPDFSVLSFTELICLGEKFDVKFEVNGIFDEYEITYKNPNGSSGENILEKLKNGINDVSFNFDTPGSYKLTVANIGNGQCFSSTSVTINQYPLPKAEIASATNPTCENSTNGQITMKTSPGKAPVMYKINNAEPKENNSFPNLTKGKYTISVTDACFESSNIDPQTDKTLIAPKNIPIPTFEDPDNPTCLANPNGNFNAKIIHPNDANFSYNYQYVLYKNNIEVNTVNTSNKNVPFNNLTGGNYKVVVHDADRPTCPTAENNISLASVAPIQLLIDATQNPTCFNAEDGFIRTEASGGNNLYNYFINTLTDPNNIGDFNNLKAGKYEVFAKTKVENCPDQSAVETIELINPPKIDISLNVEPMQCHNDNDASIVADITGGNGNFTYQWYLKSGNDWLPATNSANYQNLQSGEYKLEVSEASCTIESEVVQIINPQALTFAVVDINRPACKGDEPASINPSASGGWGEYQYFTAVNQPANWQPFTPGSTIGDGTYYLQVEDKEGCTHLYENAIQFITPEEELSMDLQTELLNGHHLTCFNSNDGSVSINGDGGVGSYLYGINNQDFISESDFNQLPAGKHTFKLKDENGCEKTKELTLTQPAQINLSILSQDEVKCFGEYSGTAELAANGGIAPYQFKLDDNDWQQQPVFNELTAQAYTVTVKDANECEVTLPFEIQSLFDPIVIDFDVTDVSCFGYSNGSINTTLAGGMPPFNYTWQQGSDNAFLQDLPAGTYQLEVADDEGCKATAEVTINEPDNIDLGDPVTICQEQDYPLDVSQPDAVAYQWIGPGDFSSDQPLVNFTEAGTYQLTLTLSDGCEMSDDFVLNYNDILFETNFLIASAAEVGDTVRLIEVCYPAPDSVNWQIDNRANILQMDKHRPLISFDQAGEYPINMAASYSGCIDSLTKTVKFYELGEMPEQGARMKLGIAGIRAIQVYPNPNQGAFTLELHLYQPDDVMFFLYDLNGNEITRIQRGGEVRYEEPVALGSYRPGIYILKAVAANDEKNIRIMIN